MVGMACRWCGQCHIGGGRCPEVKAFEYHPDGTLKRVEFFSPADYMPPLPQPAAEPSPRPWEGPWVRTPNDCAREQWSVWFDKLEGTAGSEFTRAWQGSGP